MPLGATMKIEEVFEKRNKTRSWEEYRPHELGEMLECALLHIITLEVQATHPTKHAPDLWESARFSSIFYTLCFICFLALSQPAHKQVTQTVRRHLAQ